MKCYGYGEGCECCKCIEERLDEQHEWDEHQRQAQQDQYDEWVRDQMTDEEPF